MQELNRNENHGRKAWRTGPLSDVRALDLSESAAGSFCGKLLGDLGAQVVKVEPRGGDPLRTGRITDRARFLHHNSSKQSIGLDLDGADGRATLKQLLTNFDVMIADGPASNLEKRQLGWDKLSIVQPNLVLTTVSGFGSSGPYSCYQSTHLIMCAMAGWAKTSGSSDREPLQAGGQVTDNIAGAYAAVATLAAIEGRARSGKGEHVDISNWEAAITCGLLRSIQLQQEQTLGNPTLKEHYEGRHSDYADSPSFILRCRDGYIGINVLTEVQWESLCSFIGRPQMADDPRFASFASRLEHLEEIRSAMEEAFANRDAEDIFHEGQLWRLPFGLVLTPMESLDLEVHQERGYFGSYEYPGVGSFHLARVPFVMSETPSLPFRAPLPCEHSEEVLQQAGFSSAEISDLSDAGVI